MFVICQITAINFIAIGKQYRIGRFVGDQGYVVSGKYIRAIRKISYFAKTLCLALRAKIATRLVKTFERSIVGRINRIDD